MKNKINIEDCNKFLIVHTAFLGDLAISLELVEAINHYKPKTEIDYLTTPQASEIIELSPLVNRVMQFDKKNTHRSLSATAAFAKEIALESYDCVVSLHKSFRTSYLVSKLNGKHKIGFRDAVFSSFVYNYRVQSHFSLSEHYRVLSPLSAFGIDYLEYKIGDFNIFFSDEVTSKVDFLLQEKKIKDKYVVIAPGSVWKTKKWGKESFTSLINLLEESGLTCILVGSKVDLDDCKYIEENTNAINLAGHTTIKELIYLIKRASIVVSNDSAPIHFANLVKTRVVAIFGPTSPIFGFAPIGSNDIIIENSSLICRPCQIHGSMNCPLGSLECMKSIKSEEVFQRILNKLESI